MAEEKKTPAKVEESKLTKVLNWFKTLPVRIAKPFKNMVAELKKVTWPSKKKWISSSITVLVFMLFMGVVIGLLDLGATSIVKGLVGIGNDTQVEEQVDQIADDAAEDLSTEDTGDVADDAAGEPEAEATDEPAAE